MNAFKYDLKITLAPPKGWTGTTVSRIEPDRTVRGAGQNNSATVREGGEGPECHAAAWAY